MKKMLKMLMIVALSLTITMPMLTVAPALALGINDLGTNYINTGLGNADPREIASSIINIALGFLGVLAVIIILIGGFKWMTAAGNEDQIADAKKVLMAGIIGLVIILASWGIATFVLTSLLKSTGATK
jgi:hypothetical protein